MFFGAESEGFRSVFHIHGRAKSWSAFPKLLRCLEHLYTGLRIMMNICARFTLLPTGCGTYENTAHQHTVKVKVRPKPADSTKDF